MMRGLALSARALLSALGAVAILSAPARAQQAEVIPHAQDRPPGPALSPDEAIQKMKVPEGFTVELVASEPDIVNPVAMTFDEKGRAWITESLEYPRREPGPGRDRIKVLEDTDGDGKADKFTVFAEGLNIPSGIAVGHGGVWVANSPDILFLQDTDGDGKADKKEVVVTGFGREDTHELPNTLIWGPDGWLYGWNGVFNRSHVEYRGKTYDFTCAVFRIHPRTRDFEIFCEGTSNPWGLAIDPEGSLFASACVIDHLWHLAESGYYIRQGGPYPPFAWPIDSIVDHKHQKAAYCGIHYFDSDAYPPEYRGRLYMGNIHGNCVNVDTLERNGSTYKAKAAPDFLTANDAWFMPVVQKTGPDGCLYILDWYDRYHCYQDANRDPAGIDRLKGRLYRVRYKDTPRRAGFDLAKKTDEELIGLLGSPNVYDRDIAQRLLAERGEKIGPEARGKLDRLILDEKAPRKARMHALWALLGSGRVDDGLIGKLLDERDPTFRAWGVRAAGDKRKLDAGLRKKVASLAHDPSPDVRLQVAIAARKIEGLDPLAVLTDVLARSGDDPLIPHVAWQNLHPLLETDGRRFIARVLELDLNRARGVAGLLPRVVERLVGARDLDTGAIATLVAIAAKPGNLDPAIASRCLSVLAEKVQDGELTGARSLKLRDELQATLRGIMRHGSNPVAPDAGLLLASWKDAVGLGASRAAVADRRIPGDMRLRAFGALVAIADGSVVPTLEEAVADRGFGPAEFRGRLLAEAGKLDDPAVARVVLRAFPRLGPELRPPALELLTQRGPWSKALLDAVAAKAVPADALNVNQIRRLLQSQYPGVAGRAREIWGTVREGRNPARERVVAEMREFLKKTPGDPNAGRQVFQKLCGQCHKIYGEGQEVGPDITGVGRSDFEQLVSNVFDPSLVIGPAYQATTVSTSDGRVLTGLLAEDGKERIVLKLQGGKQETIPRDEVEAARTSELSLMPEDIEKQLTREEWADLFAFLELDRPPDDPAAKRLPGTPEPRRAGGR